MDVAIRAPICPSGLTLNRSTSFLVRRGYLDPSYVVVGLTDLSASFYPLAMAFILPRDLSSSAILEVRVCTKDVISGQLGPVKYELRVGACIEIGEKLCRVSDYLPPH
jgi:hypothetical protein